MPWITSKRFMLTETDLPSGVPVDLRAASQGSTRAPGSASPTSSTASTTVEGAKKNAFPFRSSSKLPLPPPIETSPLPPVTPTKAAKLLGIAANRGTANRGERIGSPLAAQHDGAVDHDTIVRETARPRDKYGWEERFEARDASVSSETLTSRTEETGTEPNPQAKATDVVIPKHSEAVQCKPKGFWSSSKTTAKKMLEDSLPLREPITPIPSHISVASSFNAPAYMQNDGLYTNAISRIGSSQPSPPIQNAPPDRFRALPPLPSQRRKSKRKNGKDKDKFVDMMAPITESSRDDTGAYRSISENVQPGAVSEDTPTDESAEKEMTMIHGKPAELSKAYPSLPDRSLFRKLEQIRLDAAEVVAHMDKVKEDHENGKRKFMRLACDNCGSKIGRKRNDDDEVSISSSIDLDEEPTVHYAAPMPVRRVKLGEVKVVQIPARRVCC
jgi:hypothetical protein